jgi:hypothetical protein
MDVHPVDCVNPANRMPSTVATPVKRPEYRNAPPTSARKKPTVANFASVGFKWRGLDLNRRPRDYEAPPAQWSKYHSVLRFCWKKVFQSSLNNDQTVSTEIRFFQYELEQNSTSRDTHLNAGMSIRTHNDARGSHGTFHKSNSGLPPCPGVFLRGLMAVGIVPGWR